MEYKTRKLNVVLTDEEYEFITELAEHDNASFYEELSMIFRIGLERCMSLPSYKKMLIGVSKASAET